MTTTGWGVVQSAGTKFSYVDSGKIHTYSKHRMGERLTTIFTELQAQIVRFKVTDCAVESGYVGRSQLSSLQLGQARAAAILASERMGIPTECIAPREAKMAITGRGSAAKEQVSYVVGKMLGIEFDKSEEDISDALAIALCHLLRKSRAMTVTLAP